jgi:hypothetical protein
MKYLLILVLLFPLTSTAACEREEKLLDTSIDLFVKLDKLHEINKRLFELNKLTQDDLNISLTRLTNSVKLMYQAKKIYYECQTRIMV